MLRHVVVIVLLAALFTTIGDRLRADEPIQELAKGTVAMAVKLAKEHKIPENVIPGVNVDIVAKITDPIHTGIAILNVRVLGVDKRAAGEQSVTVQITPTQALVVVQMQKGGLKLGVKVRNQKADDELTPIP